MPGDVGLVAKLLSEIFGFVVDPDGWESMKVENQIEVIHAGMQVARNKRNDAAIDALFDQYRELSKKVGH